MQPKAGLFKLNGRDAIYGAVMAFLGALVASLEQLVTNGTIPHTWPEFKPVLITAIGAMLAYLLKNLFSNSAGVLAQSESKAPTVVTIPKPESNATVITETTTTVKK